MLSFLLDGPVEPVHEFLHPAGRFKRRGGLKDHADAFAVGSEGLDMVGHLFVLAAMVLVLGAVLKEYAVQLLDVVFRGGDGLVAVEDHVHRVGIARHFLLVAAGKRLAPHAGEQLLHLPVAELGALDAGGRPHALNRGNPTQARQFFRGEGLNDLPAPLELIDISDELQDFRGNGDVLNVGHGQYPFSPIYTRFIPDSKMKYPFIPVFSHWVADWKSKLSAQL